MNEETSDSNDKQSSQRQYYILTGVVAMIYSYFHMSIATQQYLEPFEDFALQCVTILLISIGPGSLFFFIFARKTGRFSEILFYATLIIASLSLIAYFRIQV